MDAKIHLAIFQFEIEQATFPRWASFKATDSIAVCGPFCFPFPNDDLFRAFLIPFRVPGPLLLRFAEQRQGRKRQSTQLPKDNTKLT